MSDSWSNYRLVCGNCGYRCIATIPTIHNAELECAECGVQSIPAKKELIEVFRAYSVDSLEG